MARADFTAIDAADPLSRLYQQLNARTEALRSFESDSALPTSPVANQFYVDSVNGIFTQRSDDNAEWIFQWIVGQAAHSFVRFMEPGSGGVTVKIREEIDNGLNVGGFTNLEEQGADFWMEVTKDSLPLAIELPSVGTYPRWDGRLCAIYLKDVDGGDVVTIRGEGGGATLQTLTRPGDFWIGRVDANQGWETFATNANEGYQEVSAAAVTVDNQTGLYVVDTSSNTVTLTLPDLGGVSQVQAIRGPITFKKTAAANNMIIDTAGSELIDGAASVSYTAQYSSVTIAVHNQAYWII